MYTLLYAALKNMGDFLIYQRSKDLLRYHKGMEEYLEFHSLKESLDSHIDEVNRTKAVIICGGPGIQWNMYPGKYKLATDLGSIKVPIIIMGSGWFGVPGDDDTLAEYGFSKSTMHLLKRAGHEGQTIGVRDYLTERALRNNGITNVQMTGCPSWYDLHCIDREFVAPDPVKAVVFTPPAGQVYARQSVEVMGRLRSIFPDTRLICSFHRGLAADQYTQPAEAVWLSEIARAARELGFEVADASYGLDNVKFYDECDLHVGYRVHGHIYFLSQRKPSFLIHEDGRGRGVSEALELPGISGWERTLPSKLTARLHEPHLSTLLGKKGLHIKARPGIADEVEEQIMNELENGFSRLHHLPKTIERHYQVMTQFLDNIP